MRGSSMRRAAMPAGIVGLAFIGTAPGALGAPLVQAKAATAAESSFAKPDPVRAFALLKVYGPDGNPIRTVREDWDGARKRVASDPAWKSWLTAQRGDMDDWMAKRHDHPEWTAGWFHDFVSPRDGSHLIWTPDEPGEYTLHSPSDPRVQLTPKLRAAWVYAFRERMASQIQTAAMLYRLTGEKKYADWAAGQLDFYADNFAAWPIPPGRKGVRLMWQSLDEAVDLVKYANAARILGDYVTPERKQRWYTELFRPDSEILNGSMQTIHNIACWQRSAVGCVALLYDDPALWSDAVESKFGIRNQMAQGVTSDYLWREQSLGYNSYVVSALLPFFEFASLKGDAPRLAHEMQVAENLMLSPIALRFPTGQLPNPADAGAPGKAPNAGFMADAARLFPTTIGIAEAQKRRDWDTLLDPLPAPSVAADASAALPPVESRSLESSREAILKRGPWQVFLHYGQLTSSHAEAEALNYEAFYQNTDVSHDPGTVGYGSPLHRDFYSTALAHNVPLIDGIGQQGWGPGKLLAFDAATTRVSAAQPAYQKTASAERTLAIEGDRLTDSVTVTTTDGKPHELGLLLQLQGKATLPAAFQSDSSLTSAGRPAGFAYWKDVTSATFTDRAAFPVTFPDGKTLQVEFAVPGQFTVTHASSPDAPPNRRDTFLIRVTGTSATFKTTIAPE